MAQAQKQLTLVEQTRQYIERIREEPLYFAREVLRHKALPGEPTLKQDAARSWELDQFQVDLLNAVADVWRKKTVINHERKPWLTVVAGHGPGKTHTAALVAHYFNSCWPGRIVVTAPKFDQVRTRMFAALHKVDYRAEAWYRKTHELGSTEGYWFRRAKERDPNWCILGETAQAPENLAGHHEQYQLVIVEEATGVPENLYPVIFSALSTGVVQILLMIANPTKRTGTFADSHLKVREARNYFRYHINFEKSSRVKKAWADKLVVRYGRNSPVVKVRVFGEFASDDPRQLLAMQWLAESRFKDAKPDGSLPRRRVSIDVADGGDCETVVALADHYQTKVVGRRMRRFSFPAAESPILAALEGKRMFDEFGLQPQNGDALVVDSIGVGAGTAGKLLELGYPVIQHRGGAASSSPKMWRNMRVQVYLAARNAFRDGQVAFDEGFLENEDDWDEFIAQLCSIKTKDNADKVEDLQTKKEMVDEGVPSPDLADCWVMQWATTTPILKTHGQHQASAGAVSVIQTNSLEGLD